MDLGPEADHLKPMKKVSLSDIFCQMYSYLVSISTTFKYREYPRSGPTSNCRVFSSFQGN